MRVLSYDLTEYDQTLILAIYAKLGMAGVRKLLSTHQPRVDVGPTVSSIVKDQAIEQLKDGPLPPVKVSRPPYVYDLIKGFQERPDLAGKDTSKLARLFAATRLVETEVGSRVEFQTRIPLYPNPNYTLITGIPWPHSTRHRSLVTPESWKEYPRRSLTVNPLKLNNHVRAI